VEFSPDGQRLVAGGDDGRVFLWDLKTGELVTKLSTSEVGLICAVGFSDSGNELVAIELSGHGGQFLMAVWRAKSWEKQAPAK
jgi:WD40 repeat protein